MNNETMFYLIGLILGYILGKYVEIYRHGRHEMIYIKIGRPDDEEVKEEI